MKVPTSVEKHETLTKFAYLDLFKTDVVLIICEPESFLKEAQKFLSPDLGIRLKSMLPEKGDGRDTRQASCYPIRGGGSIIWCRPGEPASVIVHELGHALFYLMRDRTTPLTDATEEVYAYTLETLYRKFFEVKKSTAPRKKRRGRAKV